MDILEIFTHLYQTMVEQSIPLLNKWMKDSSISLYIIIYFWIITTSCITRSFKSILLNTYYKTKPSLTVNTLEDVVNRPDLSISGSFNLDFINQFTPEVHNNLMQRAVSYETRMGIDYNTREGGLAAYSNGVIQDVVNRKGVILTNSYGSDLYKKMYPMYKLMESNTKYAQSFAYTVIHKNIPYYSRIYKL